MKALHWITDVLDQHSIPYQITGGLAAIAHGATRPLVDIDINMPIKEYGKIQSIIGPFSDDGIEDINHEVWQLKLVCLRYDGQVIELCDSDNMRYCGTDGNWRNLETDFSKSVMRKVYGVIVPVMPRDQLIAYKTQLDRDVDRIDIYQMMKSEEKK